MNADNFVVRVPCGTLDAYLSDQYWSSYDYDIQQYGCPYTISAYANPSAGGTVSGGGGYSNGDQCTLTASQNSGYYFVNWTKNGTVVSTDRIYSFTVNSSGTYYANFSKYSYTISASASPSVGGSVSGAGTYEYGSSCTLTATPATGYNFTRWTRNGTQVSTNASYTFTVQGNFSYVAEFTKKTYTINASASPSAGGSISGGGTYEHGSTCSLTAAPATGYHFVNWTVNGSSVSTNTTYSFTVTEAKTVVANFAINSYSVTAMANPIEGGTVTGDDTYNYGATATLIATASEGYTFVNWTEGETEVSTEATYSFTVSGERALVANFSLNSYAITTTANPVEGGTVTGDDTYNYGATATLSATAYEGYTFVNWTEDGTEVSTDATYSFTVTGDRTLVANFSLNGFHFTTVGEWSATSNWQGGILPDVSDEVFIDADCDLNQNAEVTNLTISNGAVLTLKTGKTLTVTGTLTNTVASSLVIEDGAQLYNTLPGVQGTVKKGIEGYGADENGGYLLITNPVQETLSPANLGMTTGEYDLYRFDQYEDLEWRNYKQTPFDLENGQGYLYANSTNTSIDFCGTLNPSNTDITVNLAYDATAQYAGFNLVGNPFVCNAYIDRPFYTMNDEGSEIVSVTGNNVEAGEGIFVVATAENETLTFTTTAPENNSKAMLVLNLIQGRGASTGSAATVIDRAIVRFDQGSLLPKFQMKSNSTKIYIPLDNTDYAVVNAESQGEMPVNFKAKEDGSYTLSLGRDEMAFNYLHLIDNLTGNDVDMLANPSYSFEAKTTDYASRFKLVFSTICEDTDGDNDTFAFISNGNIIITNADANATLQMVDVTGRVIVQGDAIYRVSTNGMPGVYILRLINGDNVKTQKIMVE